MKKGKMRFGTFSVLLHWAKVAFRAGKGSWKNGPCVKPLGLADASRLC